MRSELSWTHYRILIRVENPNARKWYLKEVVSQNCSARALEREHAVQHYNVSIRLACTVFSISQSCYYYQPKHAQENDVIADWLIQLTTVQRNWGFGLCFAYLRNIKGFIWNHKRVYRIYRQLERNLRIKPKKRVVRERPEPLVL